MSLTQADPDVDEEVAERWQDVLDAIVENRNYKLAPWQPLADEPRLAFLAFRAYLDDENRSIAAVVARMMMNMREVNDLAHMFSWQARSEMYDQWCDRQGEEARADLMRKVAIENTRAFAKLSGIINDAEHLIGGTLAEFRRMQDVAIAKIARGEKNGEDGKPITIPQLSMTQAMKMAEVLRGLLAESNRFLGVTTTLNVNIDGKIKHQHQQDPSLLDVQNFLEGLRDAKMIDAPKAIETTGTDDMDDDDE